MQHSIQKRGENPLFSIVIVDSRSDEHPVWVKIAAQSALEQSEQNLELIFIDNRDRSNSIGKCYNEGLRLASGKWVYYLGDDDYLSPDYIHSLKTYAEKYCGLRDVIVSTYSTFFDDDLKEMKRMDKMPMGAYLRSYFLDHPFNENLKRYIDIDAINSAIEDGKLIKICPFHYGYYYRQHSDQVSDRKQIIDSDKTVYDVGSIKKDFYIVDRFGTFTEEIKERYDAVRTREFLPELAKQSKIIWCEWADKNAAEVSRWSGEQIKILRVHAYEVFTDLIDNINFGGFDHIIVSGEYIKDVLISKIGDRVNISVIPVGVDLEKFKFNPDKDTQKIAYAGYLCRKKGIDKIILLANEFPDYKFYLKGKFQEEDFKGWFLEKKPSNVFIEDWDENVNEFFQDKGYVLSLSIRESFHRALAEGMATGAKPIIYDWIGADKIYSSRWIFKTIEDFKRLLDNLPVPLEYREFIERYNVDDVLRRIDNLIENRYDSRGVKNDKRTTTGQLENAAG